MSGRLILQMTIVVLCAHVGCQQQVEPIDPGHMARREALRQVLRDSLGQKYLNPVAAATAEQLDRGKKLYPQLCAACHGARGDGKGTTGAALATPPAAFTDSSQADFFSEQARLEIIRHGVPGTPMMAWATVLPETDIQAIYVYIRSLRGKD